MKNFTLLFLVLFVMSNKLNAQIPNFSFENWTNGANAAPDGWIDHGSNHAGFYPVSQTTDRVLGNFAAHIENKLTPTDTTYGVIETLRPNGAEGFGPAFPINSRYNNLKGYYKFTPQNGDSAQIIVYLTKTGYSGQWGNMLAWGEKKLGTATTYTPFSVGYLDSLSTFWYMDDVLIPDSGYINIASYKSIDGSSYNLKPLGNSILFVDALNFDSYISGINRNIDITTDFRLYPNINNGIFDVNFNTKENEYTTIKIFDLQGRELMKLFNGNLPSGSHVFHYNLPELSKGNYLYVVASENGYRTEEICIQK